jgi:CRP-like cAMP-binding protein
MQYNEGEIVGDSDALLDLPRDCKASALVDSTLYVVKIDSVKEVIQSYPVQEVKMRKLAEQKRALHKKQIA